VIKEKKPKKQKEFRLKEFLIGKLRAASKKYPPFNEAKKLAKVDVSVKYNPEDETLDVCTDQGERIRIKVVKKAQNRDRVMYRCAHCKELFFDYMYILDKDGEIKKKAMLAVDHIEPVVPIGKEDVSWDEYIARLFCDVSNLQVLCNYPGVYNGKRSCHSKKTKEEQQARLANKTRKSNMSD
jgi:hypothetical protein